ncbi:hypothetical protein FQN51_003542 [Onygenales sp. PD_10]|nr:hypothetical protein FQN51_003542 [Onygenales sp. PD_10]
MVRPFGSQGTGIIRNPLIDRTEHDLTQDVQRFHEAQQLGDAIDLDMLVKGAKIGRDPTRIGSLDGITAAERQILLEEVEARKRKSVRDLFRQTKGLHITILVTACAAISQGWQQSVINASSDLWEDEFWKGVKYNLRDRRLKVGAINAFPFLSGSLIGAWLSDPLQETRMGRRLALFLAALFSVACSIWSYRCNDWKELMACRIVLGLGIGTKASVAPVFAAEAAVDHLRGRVLMMWQLFDAFQLQVETELWTSTSGPWYNGKLHYQDAVHKMTFFHRVCAEVFPLAFREVGMSFSVMVNFAGLGLLVLLLPYYTRKLGGQGDEADEADEADGQKKMLLIFTGFNVIAFILVFLIVPSTAEPNLEEMNDIFAVSTAEHVNFQARERLPWLVRRYVLHNEGDERTLVEWQKEAQTSESNSIPLERRNSTEGV